MRKARHQALIDGVPNVVLPYEDEYHMGANTMRKPFDTVDTVGFLLQLCALLPVGAAVWLTLSPYTGLRRIEEYVLYLIGLLVAALVVYALGGLIRLQVASHRILAELAHKLEPTQE